MNGFEKTFDKLARTDDASILWINWLDWVIDQNLITNHDRRLDFKGNQETYFKLYQEWIKIVSEELSKGEKYYYDYLGVFYEDVIQSKYKAGTNGQFFTPQDVSQLMAGLLTQTPGGMINDCACGSGRLLLDAHSDNPTAILIGQDLDPVACKMAVLNFYISGVRGSIIHQDTLTLEVYECWRVNNYIHHGLPLPHIELVSLKDAYHFIGMKNTSKPIELQSEKQKNFYSYNKETVQTKLM